MITVDDGPSRPSLGLADPAAALPDLVDARILLVDDNRMGRSIIEASLYRGGFSNVRVAEDGEVGLKLAFDWRPDLIITDLLMPKLDGFDLCRWIRAEPRFADTPIIAQTAMDEPERRSAVFDAGASDLILKPINPRELLSRVRVHLERSRAIRRLTEHMRRMADELDSAKAMQNSLLPSRTFLAELGDRFPVHLASYSEQSLGLGGDLWGADIVDDHRIRIWNADFTGHGVNSALNTFRLHTYLQTGGARSDDPATWLREVNGFLCDVLPVGQYSTMLCAVADFAADTVTLASAAAPPPIWHGDDGCHYVDIGGLPLGITKSAEYDQTVLPFAPGAGLFAYSDALIETPTADAPAFPPDGLIDYLNSRRTDRCELVHLDLVARIRSASAAGLEDDLTMITLTRSKADG